MLPADQGLGPFQDPAFKAHLWLEVYLEIMVLNGTRKQAVQFLLHFQFHGQAVIIEHTSRLQIRIPALGGQSCPILEDGNLLPRFLHQAGALPE